jgi:hypothetical protein
MNADKKDQNFLNLISVHQCSSAAVHLQKRKQQRERIRATDEHRSHGSELMAWSVSIRVHLWLNFFFLETSKNLEADFRAPLLISLRQRETNSVVKNLWRKMVMNSDKCPVCDWAINDGGIKVTVGGKEITVCCDECVQKVQENPKQYAAAS